MDTLMTTNTPWVNIYLIPWGIRIITAILIFYIGRYIARALTNTTKNLMTRNGQDITLVNFTGSILYIALIAAVAIAALDQIGVQTTSLLAILGAAGLAVGLALKDSLSNFSAGVMLIIFRPFKQGDFIEAAGTSGTVDHIGIFNTDITTGDNRKIIVPNNSIFGGTITNISANPTRRIDLIIGIGYEDDLRKAKDILENILQQHSDILDDPAPAVALAELADSSINFNVRPWVKAEDYWGIRSQLLETIKITFDQENISIPYPQQDIHLHKIN
ncbi:MAG: mechanosensitive ion channel [Gammaproteobacteria bacterium]|nr:mechanosensitive ion channel [Gammaproteobacteria bacterium]